MPKVSQSQRFDAISDNRSDLRTSGSHHFEKNPYRMSEVAKT